MTNRSGCLRFAPHPFPAPQNSGDARGPAVRRGQPPGTGTQTLAPSACPQLGARPAAAGEALCGPGQGSERRAQRGAHRAPVWEARGGQAGCELTLHLWHSHTTAILSACGAPVVVSPAPRCPLGLPRALLRAQGPARAGGGAGGGERRAAPFAPASAEMQPLGKALQGRGRAPHKSGEE